MPLSNKVVAEYAKSRIGTHKAIICHAPFANLNFEQNGNVRACCYNTKHILGKWPELSIKQIWQGEKAEELRKLISENELSRGCSTCGSMITAGNHHGVRAKFYDEYAPAGIGSLIKYAQHQYFGHLGYPKVMEFELSNRCNLECVMCNGNFSSSLRKNREKLPPIESPYDDRFVDELDKFLPHLTDAKFLGGEPFMIDIYLKIWKRILKINPAIRIHITTNGTILTDRVKRLLEGLNAGIIVSIDSIDRNTYGKIRINGDFDKVMENLKFFQDYTARKKTFLSIAACPMEMNWHELPELLNFCNSNRITLYLNAVYTPIKLSLREQPLNEQEKIVAFLKKNAPENSVHGKRDPRSLSNTAYNDFIKLLNGWIEERKENAANQPSQAVPSAPELSSLHKSIDEPWSSKLALDLILELIDIEKTNQFEIEKEKQQKLARLLTTANQAQLSEGLMQYMIAYWQVRSIASDPEMETKVTAIADLLYKSDVSSQALWYLACTPPLAIASIFVNNSFNELKKSLMLFN